MHAKYYWRDSIFLDIKKKKKNNTKQKDDNGHTSSLVLMELAP